MPSGTYVSKILASHSGRYVVPIFSKDEHLCHDWGEVFVNLKTKAIVLVKTPTTRVLFSTAEIPVEIADLIMSEHPPVVLQLKQTSTLAFRPSGEEVQLAEVVDAPPVQEEATPTPMTGGLVLPATASNVAFHGLIGLMAIGGAFAAAQPPSVEGP